MPAKRGAKRNCAPGRWSTWCSFWGWQVGQEAKSGHQGSCRQRAMGFLLRCSKQVRDSTGPDVSRGVLASKVSLEKGHHLKHAPQMSSFHQMGSPEVPWESLFRFTKLMLKGLLPPSSSMQLPAGFWEGSVQLHMGCVLPSRAARAAQAPPGLGSHRMDVPIVAI